MRFKRHVTEIQIHFTHTAHSIMIEIRGVVVGAVRAEINLSNSRAKLFSPLNTLQVQNECSARVEDLICYLTLVFSVAEFFSIIIYASGKSEVKSDRTPKETGCVF